MNPNAVGFIYHIKLFPGVIIVLSIYYHIMGYFHEVQIFTNAELFLNRNFHDLEIHDPELM